MEHVQHVGTNVELGGEGDAHSHGGAEQSGIEREEDLHVRLVVRNERGQPLVQVPVCD